MPLGRVLLAVVALAATTALSACVPATGASSSPPPSESQVATPDPTPEPDPVVASVVNVSADAITVLDAGGGVLASFDYFQPGDDVVAALDRHLGASLESPYPGGTEQPPGVQHDWGGLRLVDPDAPVLAPYYPEYWVIVTTGDANGVPVTTAPGVGSPGGIRVGEPFTGVTLHDEPVVDSSTSAERPTASVRVGLVPLPPGGEYGDAPSVGVMVVGYTDDDVIDRFIAPSRNWGP